MAEVEELTDRATSLEQQAKALGEQEQALTQEIAEYHATGGGNKGKGLDALTRQRREVREQRADILETLPLLRDRIDKDREAAARAEAEKRMKGIARAYGSLRQEMDAAETRLEETAAAHVANVERFNGYYRSLIMLVAEANAQTDRFGLPRPPAPTTQRVRTH